MEKRTISDYTEVEFLEFVRKICRVEGATEEDDNKLVNELRRLAEHPDGSDPIYYPRNNREDNPEGIVKEVKEWHTVGGLPGLKADQSVINKPRLDGACSTLTVLYPDSLP